MRRILRAGAIAAAALLAGACDRVDVPALKPGEFFISTLAAPPGRSVTKSFGFYCRWFTHSPGADYGAAFTAANAALKTEGEKLGANGFIGLSVAALPAFEAKGAGGSLVMLCGDFASVK
jgi:hypothetical protein